MDRSFRLLGLDDVPVLGQLFLGKAPVPSHLPKHFRGRARKEAEVQIDLVPDAGICAILYRERWKCDLPASRPEL